MGSAYQSQNMTVLAHLQSGQSITSWEAIQRWRITRLARVVGDLKEEGYPIQSEMLCANGKRYARYWLPEEKGQLSLFQQKGLVGGSPTRPLVGDVYDNAHRFTAETTLSQVRSDFKGASPE